jgi:hypothetical protein
LASDITHAQSHTMKSVLVEDGGVLAVAGPDPLQEFYQFIVRHVGRQLRPSCPQRPKHTLQVPHPLRISLVTAHYQLRQLCAPVRRSVERYKATCALSGTAPEFGSTAKPEKDDAIALCRQPAGFLAPHES